MGGLLALGGGVSRGVRGRVHSLFEGDGREGVSNGGLVGRYDRYVQGKVVTHYICSGEQMNEPNSLREHSLVTLWAAGVELLE